MKQIYLALETSCDETAAAVVLNGRSILSNCIVSQIGIHKAFGGVVPEVAARAHLETINQVVEQAMSEASVKPGDLAGIACTVGPGLIGTLLVGLSAARSLSWAWDLPLIGVDHLSAHICANYLDTALEPPFVALLVSGGHTQILHFESYTLVHLLGETLDDAAGEAYDKVARLLGLEYPGGPAIDRLAQAGNPSAFKFPDGVVSGFDFSFSGLKTAVLRCLEKQEKPWPYTDLAASFQEAVTRILVSKTLLAQKQVAAPAIVLAGGVAANATLRSKFRELSSVPIFVPPAALCTDNAAMVASCAYFCRSANLKPLAVYSRSKHQS